MAFGALLAVGLSAFFFFARWISALDERRLEEAREKEAKEETDDYPSPWKSLSGRGSTIVEPTVFC